jgi:hypothetical protein
VSLTCLHTNPNLSTDGSDSRSENNRKQQLCRLESLLPDPAGGWLLMQKVIRGLQVDLYND